MKLHLIRHAKTLQPEINERDFDRHLMEKGKRQAKALSEYLSERSVSFEVWCSEAVRTRETLAVLEEKSKFSNVTYMNDLYLCSAQTFLEKLWRDNSVEDLIIVGHNFGISDLASYFLEQDIELRTGEYICIDFGNYSRNETSKGLGKLYDRFRYKE